MSVGASMNMLRVRPAPLGAEGLPEYLLRLADLNGLLTVAPLLRLTGCCFLKFGPLCQLAAVTGQSEAVIQSLGSVSCASWDGTQWTRSFSDLLVSGRARICPQCLEEEGVRRHVWRYQYSFCCLKHKIMLSDRCPRCEQRITLISGTATRCVCGHALSEIQRRGASAEVLEAQRRLLGSLVPPDHGVIPHVDPITCRDLAVAEWGHGGEVSHALRALRLKTHPHEVLQAAAALIPSDARRTADRPIPIAGTKSQAFYVLTYLAQSQRMIEAQCHIDWHSSQTERYSPLGLTRAELSRATGIPTDVINKLVYRGVLKLEKRRKGHRVWTVIPNDCVSAFLAQLKRHMTPLELTTTLRINDDQWRTLLIFALVREWRLAGPYSRWSLVPFDDVARMLSGLRKRARSPSLRSGSSDKLIPLNQLGTETCPNEWSFPKTLLYILRRKLDVFELNAAGTGLDCFAVSEDELIRVEAGQAQQYDLLGDA
jgi:hypothetical protein